MNTRLKIGWVRVMIVAIPRARIGRVKTKTRLIRALIVIAMMIEKISVSGARTAMRRMVWNAFCTLVTSVVSRVMMEEVLNLSMFEKE